MSTDEQSNWEWVNTILAGLAAWLGIAASLVLACWRWVLLGAARAGMLWRGLRLAAHVADRWGDESGSGFREEIEHIQDSVKELRIRLAAAETALGRGTFTTDAEGTLVYANHHAICLFGRDSANVNGRHWFTAIDDTSREKVQSLMRLCRGERIPAHCSVVVVETGKTLRLEIRPVVNDSDRVEWLSCELSEPK